MVDAQKLPQLRDLLETANNIFVIYPANASSDVRASAEALGFALSNSGKGVRVLTPRLPKSKYYPKTSEITVASEMGNQNLTVSFDYTPEQVDKVSYHIGEETGKFYLTIKPQSGKEPLNPKTIEFALTGAETDLCILVGVAKLDDLEQLYYGYEDLYKNIPVISINTYDLDYSTLSITSVNSPSLSQEVAGLAYELGLELSSSSATQLLYGIESKTNNLTSFSTTANTFEMVASLIRQGARRIAVPKEQPQFSNRRESQSQSRNKSTQFSQKSSSVSIMSGRKKKSGKKKQNN